jgi:hypothetical protein
MPSPPYRLECEKSSQHKRNSKKKRMGDIKVPKKKWKKVFKIKDKESKDEKIRKWWKQHDEKKE